MLLIIGVRFAVDALRRGHRHTVSESTPSQPPSRPTGDGPLQGIAAIRNFFRTNETPVYFVSATAFNLLGIDRWVRSFRFINYYDSFDGTHPNVFTPSERNRARSALSRRSATTCWATRRSSTTSEDAVMAARWRS